MQREKERDVTITTRILINHDRKKKVENFECWWSPSFNSLVLFYVCIPTSLSLCITIEILQREVDRSTKYMVTYLYLSLSRSNFLYLYATFFF